MKPREKQYILEQIGRRSISEMAQNLNLKERAVRKFLDRIKQKTLPQPTPRQLTSPPWHKFLPFLLIIAGLAGYANSFQGVFLLDDHHTIVDHHAIRSLWPPWAYLSLTRPLVYLTLAVNYALGGLEVWGYHAVNLLIHLLAALTLYGLLRRTFLSDRLKERYGDVSESLAFATSLLWLLHPLQSQSVTYLIQRAESLMGLFYLLTLYAVSRSNTSKAWPRIAILTCALGMATKEVMVTAPILCLLYDRIFLASSFKEIFQKRLHLYLGLGATWGVLAATLFLQDPVALARSAGFGEQLTSIDYALTQPGVILHYLKLSFWPDPLCFDYGWPVAKTFEATLPPLFLIGALLVAAFVALRLRPELGFLGAWFFLILAPTSSLLPLRDFAFEHRMYLPLAAVLVLAVLTGYKIFGKWTPQPFLSFCSLLIPAAVFGTLTYQRNQDYASPVTIWQDTVAKRPHNARAHINLGNALHDEGALGDAEYHLLKALEIRPVFPQANYNLGNVLDEQGKQAEAVQQYRRALAIDPNYADAHHNLGVLLSDQGKLEEAIEHYNEALRIDPRHAEAHNSLGIALGKQGKLEAAVEHYKTALVLEPDFSEAHNNLGVVLAGQGKLNEAVDHYELALRIDPKHEKAKYNLGKALVAQGKYEMANRYYSEALAIDPNFAEAHLNLGLALAEQKRLEEAIFHYDEALRAKPDFAEAHINLGIVLAKQGKFEEAIDHYTKVIALDPTDATAHYNLGKALADQAKFADAADRFRDAVSAKPDFVEALNNLGAALYAQGKADEAISYFSKALELKPDHEDARKNLQIALDEQKKESSTTTTAWKKS